ncbi:MAG: aspartate/glutamate racemase family protein, partial [Calditrichia bacterium]
LLVDNRPEIPDRTAFILGRGPSPVPMLQESARLLERWGADFIAIPCNSAHVFIGEIELVVNVPLLNMLALLGRKLSEEFPPGSPVGLLSTTGALRAGIFDNYLSDFKIIKPAETVQNNLVMEAVYGETGIKKGGSLFTNRRKLLEAISLLQQEKPAAIIAGCTEVELALEKAEPDIPVFFPLDILADEIVRQAIGMETSG